MENHTTGLRLCLKCREEKSKSEFSPRAKGRDGLNSYCHSCEAQKAIDQRKKNTAAFKGRLETPKRCSGCKRVLESSCFGTERSRSDGRQPACKECYGNWQRERAKRNKASYEPASGVATCSLCKKEKPVSEFSVQRQRKCGHSCRCLACNAKSLQELRIEILAHYAGGIPHCGCCGETILEFLSIDHIEGGGGKHRETLKGVCFYRWLKREGYPAGYRILCHNCNQATGFYGVCPHQRRRLAQS